MFNVNDVTAEQIEKGKELGYVVDAGAYENEAAAENEGFYWYDEVDRWIATDEFAAEVLA